MRGKTSAAPNGLGERHAWKAFMKSPSPIYGYGFAIMAVGVALLVKLLLDPLTVQDTPFLLVFSAVMVSAWYGGLGPGFLATALAALITDYYFLHPVDSFSGPNLQAIPLFTFVLEGLLICLLVEALRSARLRAEESARETERHQESLRESERLYRAVVENAAENIFLVDAETKRILQTNPAFNRSLGYAVEELKEMTLYDFVAADRHIVDRNIERIRGGGTFAGERCYRCKDGTFIDVEVSASAISHSGREAMCVVAHDVTERKRSEVALRRSLDALLALYEAGQILSSSLERAEIGAKLLEITRRVFEPTAAAIDLREGEQLRLLRTVGPEDVLTSVRNSQVAEGARREILQSEVHCSFELDGTKNSSLVGLILPLRVRDQTIGLLEIYGHPSLKEGEVVETCESLANQAASALENARLYEELAQRERQLHELVGRLLSAQEEERRRVAYDVHDGLAQTAAAAYQYLQGFARLYPPGSARGREELEDVLELVRLTVRESSAASGRSPAAPL